MIDLFLVRHTKAVEGALYGDDAERPLAADGRQAAIDIGAAMARHGVKLDAIVASPLVRAVETAELIAVQIGFGGGLEIDRRLVPEASAGHMRDLLARRRDGESVALVGHQPSMGGLLSSLLGRSGLSFSKGAVVRLEWTPRGGPARLVWSLTPRRLDPVASLDGL